MYFQAQPMPGSMSEGGSKSMPRKHLPGGGIDFARPNTGPDKRDRRVVSFAHRGAKSRQSWRNGANRQRPRQIHGVSVVDPPEVQHHSIALTQSTMTWTGMRARTILPRRHDRLECGPLESR